MTVLSTDVNECAAGVMGTIPLVMRSIGMIMHQRHAAELSFPQFRALMIVNHHAGASLSLVADHLGSTLSSASKCIDGLVERQLISRDIPSEDRRRIMLNITPRGEAILQDFKQEEAQLLAEKLADLSEDQCRMINEVMRLLAARCAGKATRIGEGS